MYCILKKLFLFSFLIIAGLHGSAQYTFSIATDLNLLHNFTKDEAFTTIGQTVYYQLHISKKETGYALISYHTGGKVKNNITAIANNATTFPQKISFSATSKIKLSQISLGWKHYFRGGSNEEQTWGLYSTAGFGLLTVKVENTFNKTIDTLSYKLLPTLSSGTGNVKRLTVDLGLGGEIPIGPSIYFYGELRTWIPASNFPSPYLYNNKIPKMLLLSGGVRILFD
ncbi:MAG: hypothetical protein ABIN57_02460 [Chitinophagaceae bacterium]